MSECRVCLVEHDREIHVATVSIHGWLRRRLAAKLEPQPVVAAKFTPYQQNLSSVTQLRCPASRRKAAGK